MISGIINVLKPAGITSNQAISKIKRILKPNKIGHLGTLDPSGTGVLPVCINKATKLFDYYLKKDKHYRAIFVFGAETDTLDSDGKIVNTNDKIITSKDIISVLKGFVGKQDQMPPKYSAKKVNGKTAYDLARNNIDFELKPKEIEIYNIQLLTEISQNKFLFDIHCSSGTYIRSIARDIAYKLGTYAYMSAIIRISSGNFNIEDSVRLDDITEQSIIPIEKILEDKQNIFVNDKFYDKLCNGCTIIVNEIDKLNVVVYCKNELFGIADIVNGKLKIHTNLREKND